MIPEGVDVLLAHSPPLIGGYRIDVSCDDIVEGCQYEEHYGSPQLTPYIYKKRPKFLVCGHIHSGTHTPIRVGNTIVVNVSLMSEKYTPKYPVVELIEKE
jgi:Icc-related predicted phosphoesterase